MATKAATPTCCARERRYHRRCTSSSARKLRARHDMVMRGKWPDGPINRSYRNVGIDTSRRMALPTPTRFGILPTEMEYVASTETLVDIIPLVSLDRVRLLTGTYGPFRPPAQAQVPLWLAISLRKKRKCVVVPPAWLSVGTLLIS